MKFSSSGISSPRDKEIFLLPAHVFIWKLARGLETLKQASQWFNPHMYKYRDMICLSCSSHQCISVLFHSTKIEPHKLSPAASKQRNLSITAKLRPTSYVLTETALHKRSSEEPTKNLAALPSWEQDRGMAPAIAYRYSLLLAL